jgi:holin-like protein
LFFANKYGKITAEFTEGCVLMKYIKQLLIILLFTLLGELLAYLLPLPIPAAIYGLVLLFIALCTGLLKPSHIDETARFLLQIMSILFVAPTVGILSQWGLIAPNLVPIVVIMVVSTLVVFTVSGLVTRALLKKGGKNNG